MSASAAAHVHAPVLWPAIDKHVAFTNYRIGATPIYQLKPDTNANEAKQVMDEVRAQWRGRAISLYAGQITIAGVE